MTCQALDTLEHCCTCPGHVHHVVITALIRVGNLSKLLLADCIICNRKASVCTSLEDASKQPKEVNIIPVHASHNL